MNIVHTILVANSQSKCLIYQVDVELAFLNDDLKEEVYVAQPLRF